MGGISRRGDPATRRVLVIAATVLLSGTQQWNSLKAWGVRLAKRISFSKARSKTMQEERRRLTPARLETDHKVKEVEPSRWTPYRW